MFVRISSVHLWGLALAIVSYVSPVCADAQQGLGSGVPGAPDVSVNPNYHVYRWVKDGISYLQLNDLKGGVLMAVEVVQDQLIVLPMGSLRAVPKNGRAVDQLEEGELVYGNSDATISVKGDTFEVTVACGNPADCSTAMMQPSP
ncbi:hypothetical protein EO087_01740 [Dyella sp. M7H15-1]|uniref:hypothetical protein n=1 Tax=Dyella sp. M7H15-1 TaxID=2501295 RepID=UPI001005089A|nr:hypothetical protein [Dyella sp. M7H15-1]QAU22865.1 hypothetical protein EO087_01740 [Dyella sp. M7H15-1]